ncbi:MAG: DUF364 domain-containing protein [Gaiellales bacterium]|nr:DUF364 domain-containing protein [Gaiellales bacterium]
MADNDPIVRETIDHVKAVLGEDLEGLTVERAALGLFFSGVKLSDGHGGLCFTPIKEIPEAVCCPSSARAMPLSGRLKGRSAQSYLDDLWSGNVLKRALGIATLNALSAACWEKGGGLGRGLDYQLELGKDAFDEVQIDAQKKTVVVGALIPIVKRLLAAEADFHILEMDPATLRPRELPYYAHATRAGEFVPQADLLVITGTTLLNDTLPGLLEMAKPGAEIVVTGPTAGMLPDAFFARGTTVLGGILVTKADELLDIISEGGSGYHFFGRSAERLVIRGKRGRPLVGRGAMKEAGR